MKILVTGAGGNVGHGIVPRLAAAGHTLVLSDVNKLPEAEPYAGHAFVQADVQIGVGLERAAMGCDAILHLPAWHGIHWNSKTEADFWRLNVDGTFWMFQAAQSAGIKNVVFLSSQAWHGHYDKYGFTKRVGEELCEYNRQRHGIRYVAIRPADFTPYRDFLHYGARLLYGGVDREDVLDCIEVALSYTGEKSFPVNAVRPNVYTEAQLEGWAADPLGTCEGIFPGSRALLEKYGLGISGKPHRTNAEEIPVALGWEPKRHFGTFVDELRRLDETMGEEKVRALVCPYH
ncbi:MAG: NAD(P)-dependent oxidoreductase [Armatimonas sp.]